MPVGGPPTPALTLTDQQIDNLSTLLLAAFRTFVNNNLPNGYTTIARKDAINIFQMATRKLAQESQDAGL